MKQKIYDEFNKLGIDITDVQAEQFIDYYDFMIEENQKMNLTAITEFNDVVIKHFVDSCLLLKAFPVDINTSVIDIGTGAGFPGIPLKIICKDIHVTLLDSLNKRVNFLNNTINMLGLTNIEAIHGRAEDYAHNNKYREKYDLCVSRAVANLSTLSEYCLPFVRVGGRFISYKALDCKEELDSSKKAIRTLGGCIVKLVDIDIPDTDIVRKFILINKENSTGIKYPRKAGTPSKEPL